VWSLHIAARQRSRRARPPLVTPSQAVWQHRVAGRPASMFSPRRILWRLWRLEHATTRVLDHSLAYSPRSSPDGSFVYAPSLLPPSAASLARRRRLSRSESSHPPARLSLSPAVRGPFLFLLSAHGAAPPTLGSAPACAAPSPPPHRSGGTSLLHPSLFDTGTHRSNRARLAPVSPCTSGEARHRLANPPSVEGRSRRPLTQMRLSSYRVGSAIRRAGPVSLLS
jgi:hypothetical protein